MAELLESRSESNEDAEARALLGAVLAPPTEIDERAARRTLLDQIARLEGELADLFCTTFPREGFEWAVRSPRGGPRVLPLAELERVRDGLAMRLAENRVQLDRRALVEERNRGRIEHMLLEPEKHKWEIVSNEDIGEPGCRHWHVRPRYGIVGMFLNWWRVRISSGCPLAGGRGPRAGAPLPVIAGPPQVAPAGR
jgi:hypothetical protein